MKCRSNRGGAFTLLEVIVAVAIVAMVTLTIYRFVEVNLRAVQISTDLAERDQQIEALFSVLQAQLLALSPGQTAALLGEPHKFGPYSSDEMSWICAPGNGLFTSHAQGEHRVTLKLAQAARDKAALLGLSRLALATNKQEENWLALIQDVLELRIRYFDARLNAWLDKWTDMGSRPALVRIELLLVGDSERLQRILRVAKESRPGA